ncbi:MAG: hypothetical protein ACR2KZ_17830 [Segetibacter sp.]
MRHNSNNNHADSPAWVACEKEQYHLAYGLGCSEKMFEQIPGKTGYYRPKSAEVADCQTRVDAAKNAQVTASDGTKSTAATAAAPPANAGGGGVQPDGGSTADSNNDTPCHGGALGWVLCPLVNTMADGVRAIASFIDGTLQFKILANNSQGNGGGIKDYWGRFVGLANILLVIAFLFIIYSQATGAGLSNYGIKRMLPRIVLAAILINLSFYICALAIDAANIIGNAVLGFFTGDSQGISAGLAKQAGLSGPGGFQSAVGATLGAAIGVVLIVLFFTPLLLGVLVTFILLIARQVILIALVMVSPLAFAAWLLPNTEEYFKKWRKMFTDMLVAYPVIMAVFGVSLFASKVIGDISTQHTDNSTDLITSGTVSYIVSLVILAVPLLALPFLLKSASGSLGKVAGQFDRFKRESGLESGLNKVQGGAKGFAKKKTLDAEASIGKFGLDAQGKPTNNSRRASALRRVGTFRGVRKFNKEHGESERQRFQEEGLANQYLGTDKRSADLRKKAAGVGGAEGATRVAQSLEGVARKRRLEESEREQQPLKEEKEAIAAAASRIKFDKDYASNPITAATKAFEEAAAKEDDSAGIRAAAAELTQGGAAGVDTLHGLIAKHEGNANTRRALVQAVNDNYGDLKPRDVAITGWAGKTDSIQDVAVSSGTYEGLTVEQVATQTPQALNKAVDSGGVSKEIASSVLNSPAQSKLNTSTRATLENHAGRPGSVPASPGTTATQPQPTQPGSQTPGGVYIPTNNQVDQSNQRRNP